MTIKDTDYYRRVEHVRVLYEALKQIKQMSSGVPDHHEREVLHEINKKVDSTFTSLGLSGS